MNEQVYVGINMGMFRPYFYDGRHLNNILLHYDGKVVLESGHGWFSSVSSIAHDVESIMIDKPRRARIVNLDKKDNFYILHKSKWSYDEKKWDLYIYLNPIFIEVKEEVYEFDKHFVDIYQIPLQGVIKSHPVDDFEMEGDRRQEPLPIMKKINKVIKQFKDAGININQYEAKNFLTKYRVVKKKVPGID